jgi:polyhydroxybutyrate depolymerase
VTSGGAAQQTTPTRRSGPVGPLLCLVALLAAAGCSRSRGTDLDPIQLPDSTTTMPTSADVTTTVATSAATTSLLPSTTVLPTSTMPAEFDPYAQTAAASPAIGTVSDDWVDTPDGRQRHYRLYVPSALPADASVPLLVALHGGLGSSEQFAVNSGFDELAESNGFIVVYPDGIPALPDRPGLQTWNGGYCCGPAARDDVDDVGYIRLLIDLLADRLPIDPARVFAVGHSNGGILAYRLACELSDRIAAIGVQAGSLGVDECRPAQQVSVLHLHGLADTNHPIDGGTGTGVSGVEFRSGREAVRILAASNGCGNEPLVEGVPSNPDIEVTTWSNCGSGATVRLMTVVGASHAWMGHPAASAAGAALVGEPYPGLDASRTMWSFLAAHPRA